jgi:hypothetical protein
MKLTDAIGELGDLFAIAEFGLFCANQTLHIYEQTYVADKRVNEMLVAIEALCDHPDETNYHDLYDARKLVASSANLLGDISQGWPDGPGCAMRALCWAGSAFVNAYLCRSGGMDMVSARGVVTSDVLAAANCAQLAAGCAAAEGLGDPTCTIAGNAAIEAVYHAQLERLSGQTLGTIELAALGELLGGYRGSFGELVRAVRAACAHSLEPA